MSLGENIKLYRKKQKLTQVQLADKANISRSYLADVENNRYNPSVDTLKNISNALGVNLNELLSDNELTSTSDMPKKLSPEVETIAAHLESKDKEITPKKMKLLKRYIDDLFDDFDDE